MPKNFYPEPHDRQPAHVPRSTFSKPFRSNALTQYLFLLLLLIGGTGFGLKAQTILSATPDTSQRGQSFTMVLTGSGTNFLAATGANIRMGSNLLLSSSWNATTSTNATANFSIPANQPGGNYNVEVFNTFPLFNGHYVRPASITSISPDSAGLTQTVNVILNGTGSYWTQGVAVSMFGPGGTLNASSVTVNSTSNLVATFSIPANPVNIGTWTVFVSTGESYPGFEVLPGGGGINYGRVEGKVYDDQNFNCVFDGSDNGIPNRVVTLLPGPYYASTNSSGNYGVWVPLGNYSVSTPLQLPDTFVCPPSGTINGVNVTTAGAIYSGNDFSVDGPTYSDYYIHFCPPPIRPGFTRTIPLWVNNYGQTNASNTQVKFKLPPFVTFLSSIPANSTLSGDTVIWNLGAISSLSPSVTFVASPTVPIGTPYSLEGWVIPNNTDVNLANNYQGLSQAVTGAYDPNDKQVFSPDGSNADGFIEPTDSVLRYMIRFQNTGNDTAFNIYVRDTLDPKLNISTFRMLQASHNYVFNIGPGGEIEWTFANILLPDSGRDQQGSNGMLFYEIDLAASAVVGDTISNRCGIYFDFNAPIITNTVHSILCPSYQIAWTNSNPSAGTVDFVDLSNGAVTWLWDFGDGDSSTTQNPTHVYTTPGNYTVCLYTENGCGRPDTLCQTVSVLTGIEDPALRDFSLYPSPNQGDFVVEIDLLQATEVSFELYNSLGAVLEAKQVQATSGKHQERFDIQDQPAGIYVLRLEINGQQLYRKVSKL